VAASTKKVASATGRSAKKSAKKAAAKAGGTKKKATGRR
jgi:hypothetical protein